MYVQLKKTLSMNKKLLLSALFFAGISCISMIPQDKVVKKIIEIGQTDNQTMNHLDVLSNRFGGRLTGSDSYNNAAEWCASKFKEWGMQVEMHETGSMPVGFNRGPWFGKLLGENAMSLHFATPSYTSGTKGVQRGHVVLEPRSMVEFEKMKGKLKGAWVLISGKSDGWPIDFSEQANQRRRAIIDENKKIQEENDKINRENWENRGGTQRQLLAFKEEPALFYEQFKTAGILGIIQAAPVPIRVLYDRKNVDKMKFDSLPSIPDIKLDEKQYEIIYKMAKERQYFQLEFDIRNYFKPGPVKYHSVIGIIPGTKYPNEYVVLSSHLDAFDVASGGVDNGAGVTPHMEAARLIMKAGGKPERTILVCLWSAEEFGLLGSLAWVKDNKNKMAKISNVINRDGGPTVITGMNVTEAMWKDMEEICKPLSAINPAFPFELKKREPTELPKSTGGSDHSSFTVEGVPAMGFNTGDPKGYDFNYGEIWHTERDMYNMSIPEYQEHTAIVTAIVTLGIANLNHILSREGYYKPKE